MISTATARALRAAGLAWTPRSGDRFVVATAGMDEDVFVVSEMVIEHFRGPSGDLLRFNGTTEWALDQVQVDQAVWLPREDQLREALGDRFVALARGAVDGWVVTTTDGAVYEHADAEEAYAVALAAGLRTL